MELGSCDCLTQMRNVVNCFQLVIKLKGRRKLGTKYTVAEHTLLLSNLCLESNPLQ